MIRLLISGGPGSGCTSTAQALGRCLGLPAWDSDAYFHKPTNPPFQERYTPEERRNMLGSVLGSTPSWILSGSVATWGLDVLTPTHGIFLNIPREERLARLAKRQRNQFAARIEAGGDMEQEHVSFLEWAAGYEDGAGPGRNQETDRAFLETHCSHFLTVTEVRPLDEIVAQITRFLTATDVSRAF
jgi:adenylate kinase family enzyme